MDKSHFVKEFVKNNYIYNYSDPFVMVMDDEKFHIYYKYKEWKRVLYLTNSEAEDLLNIIIDCDKQENHIDEINQIGDYAIIYTEFGIDFFYYPFKRRVLVEKHTKKFWTSREKLRKHKEYFYFNIKGKKTFIKWASEYSTT